MNDNMQEDCAERVHVDQQQLFSERAYYTVARGQFGKNFPPPVLDGTNGTTPLNDSKNAAGFAARANALTAFGIYQREKRAKRRSRRA